MSLLLGPGLMAGAMLVTFGRVEIVGCPFNKKTHGYIPKMRCSSPRMKMMER